ncbi:hypothetical protein V500_05513 [Pseudogymnoascus sp. VKM F-4518 (FW-2643)]|nr:hypothetical protein V500_05513 [Pseudogymnoascus sp. VKM F-4518 (FW-2643)]
MRTTFATLFAIVALAAPTFGQIQEVCRYTDYPITQCCPTTGPCTYTLMPHIVFDASGLKEYCGKMKQVASCCLYPKYGSPEDAPQTCKTLE